jgi:uncharacterized protein involved in exopolysaccharide biosynthesis
MKNQEFSLYESMERALARWWMMVILMIIGGSAGWIFHLFYPPVYEAKAVITINMDFEKRQLTQYEEDSAFSAAGAIITSSDVKNLVIAEAQVNGYSINLTRIQEQFYLEGKQSVWELRVRDHDPKVAAELTNIWAEKATDALNLALNHALQAEQLQVQIDGLENCLAGTPGQVAATQLNCKGFSQEQIQVMLQDRTGELVQEKSTSLGIIPIMAFGLTESASVPEKPAIYGQASLVMAGAFIGLVVSLWGINTLKVSHHD